MLLCPPTYFEFEPINVITEKWLKEGQQSNKEACMREHEEFQQAYRENGVEVILMNPNENLPYQVFARDFGGCLKEGYVAGKFREPCRVGELAEYEKKMKELGIPCIARCTAGAFEGGDFWMLDEYTLAHGVIARTDWDGFYNVRRQINELGYEMVGVQCDRPNLHLDMCFNIVADKLAVVCEDALPSNFLAMLKKRGFQLINVEQEEVYLHHANLQCLGNDRVISFKSNKVVNEQMRAYGLKVIEVDLKEILKGGGGPHCMSFPLERV